MKVLRLWMLIQTTMRAPPVIKRTQRRELHHFAIRERAERRTHQAQPRDGVIWVLKTAQHVDEIHYFLALVKMLFSLGKVCQTVAAQRVEIMSPLAERAKQHCHIPGCELTPAAGDVDQKFLSA